MLFSDSHILSTILFTPLVGAILMLFIPSNRPDLHRWMGNIFGFLGLAVSLPLLWRFDSGPHSPRFQFVTNHSWIPSIWRALHLRHRRPELPLSDAHHRPWPARDSFVLVRHQKTGKRILHPASPAADRHARRFHVPRLRALLRFLGSNARAHVFPDRRLGQRTTPVRRDQVFPLYARRLGPDATWRFWRFTTTAALSTFEKS